MAIVNYTINTSTGDDWAGTFVVTTTTNSVQTELPTSITSTAQNFTPAQFAGYGGSGTEYVTWRSVDISGQVSGPPNYLNVYPTTGYSLDIWSGSFYTAVVTNSSTWDNLNGQTYNLSTTKNTLLYDYTNLRVIYYGVGGTISFTI